MEANWNGLLNSRRKPTKIVTVARNGPAPASSKDVSMRTSMGSLDGDLSQLEVNKSAPSLSASSRALLIYFAKLANGDNTEMVDFEFVETLVKSGADVNVGDAHGQGVMHEIARNWHPDVALFLIKCGANVNKKDNWGRTPLHLAASANYPEMINFLIKKEANLYAKTLGELQSPIHYAAKYNAVGSLRELIENHAAVDDRDYKGRTPLYLAAENGREESARYLIDLGIPAGVYSDSGMSVMALMIQKMPNVAQDALKQFVIIDTAFRKEFYYLNYLEGDPKKWYQEYKKDLEKKDSIRGSMMSFEADGQDEILLNELNGQQPLISATVSNDKIQAPSPLKVAVKCKELQILMDPVMQQLISVKWERFGKLASIFIATFHFIYLMIWTWLGFFLPPTDTFYTPPKEVWWRIVLEMAGCLMTLCFIGKQLWEFKVNRTETMQWRQFRIKDVSRDLDYCHVRWPDERIFIDAELKEIRHSKERYFADFWNIFDCIIYACVISLVVTRFTSGSFIFHKKLYTFVLILMWLHFMKSCRPFTSLGPFILMLGHVISDTLRFAFLFFEFFIPFLCGFWIAFGGPENAETMTLAGADPIDWEKFNNLMFTVWQITLIADFNFDGITSVDRMMAQAFVGLYLMVTSVLCMNLYIALLSDTFTRVYQNARANATLLQASTILQYEASLPLGRRRKIDQAIYLNSAPLETYQQPSRDVSDNSTVLCHRMTRQILNRIDACEDYAIGRQQGQKGQPSSATQAHGDSFAATLSLSVPTKPSDLAKMLSDREKTLGFLRQQLKEVKLLCQQVFGPNYNSDASSMSRQKPPGLLRSESKTLRDDELLRRVLQVKMADPMNVVNASDA